MSRVSDRIERLEQIHARLTEYMAEGGMLDSAELNRWNAAQELSNAQADLQQIEYQITFDVETETGGSGKPAFSNAEKRKIEIARRMRADDDALAAASRVREAQNQKYMADRTAFQIRDSIKLFQIEHSGLVAILNIEARAMEVTSNGE